MARRILRPLFVRRFADARRGAVAVEFAFVAFPFILLLFGILELALVFIVTTTLESATESAGRKIRTGEFQTGASHTKKDFRDSVCARMTWLSTPCQDNLYIDVRTFAANDFAGMSKRCNRGRNRSPSGRSAFCLMNRPCFRPRFLPPASTSG